MRTARAVSTYIKSMRAFLLPSCDRLLEKILPYRTPIVIIVQGGAVAVSYLSAFLIRFEGELSEAQLRMVLDTLPLLLFLRMLGCIPFGLFQGLWRYVGLKDLRNISASVSVSSLLFAVAVRYLWGNEAHPRSIFIIDWFLCVFLLLGIRLVKRVYHVLERGGRREMRVLIVGAGDAGVMLLREIEMHPSYGYHPVGFVDDDLLKKGTRLRGVPVLGTRRDLDGIVQEHQPALLLIAIPAASPEVMRAILQDCRRTGLPIKMLPGFREILFTRELITWAKDVEPEDLLSRPPITLSLSELKNFYQDKVILVTGAGGSIGSELVRQLAHHDPCRLILYEQHESSLYHLGLRMKDVSPHLPVVPVLGDVTDMKRVSQVLKEHRPQIIFHAAAYKHVSMAEDNPQEAVKVNILGTKRMAELAMESEVERFVFISTDKAVNPVGIMGATKRVAELMLQGFSRLSATAFIAVRFGNVLESSGSVVPLFKEQIKKGGPLTVTHPEATRYFMTIAEAVHLVLHATTMGKDGETFVLEMGKPIKVLDLAKNLLTLYGYEPDRDIQIVFSGLRPGEKLTEELFHPGERVVRTGHPKILMAVNGHCDYSLAIMEHINQLEQAAGNGGGGEEIREVLKRVSPL